MTPSFTKINTEFYDTTFLKKYNYLSSIYQYVLPNDIKEVFKWVNFITANVPMVQSALDKMASISITSLSYLSNDLTELTQDDALSWKSILEDEVGIIERLKEIGFNFLLYANQFISVNFPIDRTITCSSCETKFKRKNVEDVKLKPKVNNKELVFTGICPSCGKETAFTISDRPIEDLSRMKIISWPVNSIDLYEDEITGVKTIYYNPSEADKELIKNGNKDKLFNLPKDIIIASLTDGKIKFNETSVLHVRNRKFNSTNTSWGIPMLTSAIPDMISLLLLRKMNEKIYSDMILPLRGLVPRVQGVDQQPIYNYMGGSDLKNKVEGLIKSWKKDPTAIKFFPIPLEPINLFGEGKNLELSQEIDAYSTMIMTSIGVPPEFVKGGLSYSGAGASLRVLQNQLIELTKSLEQVANFIIRQIANRINKEQIKVKLVPIKLIDDIADKQNMLNLLQAGKVSGHTALDFFDLDYHKEQERMMEEQKEDIRRQLELQRYQQDVATSLEDKIKQESMMENSSAWNINQTAIIQEADTYVQQLQSMDYGVRKSKLDELAKENPVLYAVVRWRMEFLDQKQKTQSQDGNTQQ